jgi:hypothetical protein
MQWMTAASCFFSSQDDQRGILWTIVSWRVVSGMTEPPSMDHHCLIIRQVHKQEEGLRVSLLSL